MKVFYPPLVGLFLSASTLLAAPRPTPPAPHRFEISKVDMSGGMIAVTNEHGEVKSYHLSSLTQILVNNQRGTINDLQLGMSVQVSGGRPGEADRVIAANGVLGTGDAASKNAPAETRVHIPASSVESNPVIVGAVKAGQVIMVEPIKVWWTGGGTKAGKYCDWKGYERSNINGHPWMSVVAAVGKDSHAPANNTLSFTVAADGVLVVYANDDKAEGNVGGGDVRVKVQ